MTRKQKRAKRMRRRQHQKATSTGVKLVHYNKDGSIAAEAGKGITTIEVPRGPRRNDQSFHKTDKPKHGERLDARGLLLKGLAELGIHSPDENSIREFSKLVKRSGSITAAQVALKPRLDAFIEQQRKAAEEAGAESHQSAAMKNPSHDEWQELEAAAKKRKRGAKGYIRVLENAGYTLADSDPRQRESWVK